jgi:dihydroorotate dehydrogenase
MKNDLYLSRPLMNAAGTLGFAPDLRAPFHWAGLGAFVTNPVSLGPRRAAAEPAALPFPGGFLLHSGLPNPGFKTVLRKYAPRWADAPLPVIVHLMAAGPEDSARMVQALEGRENMLGVELGFPPQAAGADILAAVQACLGELPLIVCLDAPQLLSLGSSLTQAGAAALSVAAPRGMLTTEDSSLVTGRLYGPGLFAQALHTVHEAARLKLPIIGAGGVYTQENAQAMLKAGALAVQLDAVLWKDGGKTFEV